MKGANLNTPSSFSGGALLLLSGALGAACALFVPRAAGLYVCLGVFQGSLEETFKGVFAVQPVSRSALFRNLGDPNFDDERKPGPYPLFYGG